MAQPITADTVAILDARPVEAELVAKLIFDTDTHLFGGIHGHDLELANRHLAAQWTAEGGVFSHRHSTAAWDEDRIVGICLGFDLATKNEHVAPFIETAASAMSEEEFASSMGWFGRYGFFALPEVPEDAWYLQNLSVRGDVRSRGVGAKLFEDCVGRCRGAGYARLHLDVSSDNPAVRFYERMGMTAIVETRVIPLEAEGVPPHLRMELDL